MKKHLALLIAGIGLIASASAQLMDEVWRTYSDLNQSWFYAPSFAPGSRYLFTEISPNSNTHRVVCADGQGVRQWQYSLSPGQQVKRILSTTDGRIHFTTNRGTNGLITLDLQGNQLWSYSIASAPDFRLIDCRIFGNDLLVVGVGRANTLLTSPRTLVIALDRFTGAEKYKREYLINGAAFTGEHLLRSSGGNAFIIANRNELGTGILKLNPATGDAIASYATSPFTAEFGEVDSGGQIYLSGVANPSSSSAGELRKVNGSGAGAMTQVFRKAVSRGGPVLLSKGFVYLTSWPDLFKLRSTDGGVVWYKTAASQTEYANCAADSTGRIYARYHDNTTGTFKMSVLLLDPATGAELETIRPSEGTEVGNAGEFALNSYGEVLFAGNIRPGQLNYSALGALYFSPQEPVNDVYSVAQGESLTTNGNGVLVNDLYTNPAATWVSKVAGSGPSKGQMVLSANGEFFYEAKHGGNIIAPGPQTFRYRSVRQGVSREAQVTINITRGLIGFTLARYSIAGAGSISGKVVLSSSGPAGTVYLSETSDYVSLPASVVVPSSTVLGTFTLDALEVAFSQTVTLTARHETSTRTLGLTLNRIALASFTGTQQVVGGNNAGIDVMLNGRAGPGGVDVVLSETSPYVTVPETVHVPEGELIGTGIVQTLPPPTTRNVLINVSYGGVVLRWFLKLIAP